VKRLFSIFRKNQRRDISLDDRKFSKRRAQLVEKIRKKGIKDERVLSAIGKIPRHKLIVTALHNRAYEDTALPIGLGQTISQPYTVAAQTELLQLKDGDKVLEIGTGSGYQAMVLCEMGAKLYSVERHQKLYERAKDALREMGYKAMLKQGDGTLGWTAYAPYDAIVVTAGAPVVPEDLVKQLEVGGRLVIPVGDSRKQTMLRLTRISEDEIKQEEFDNFKFVPLIGEKGWG
jgi:protein-L-isoaspartate(D-aspartate) O-methyltransferase